MLCRGEHRHENSNQGPVLGSGNDSQSHDTLNECRVGDFSDMCIPWGHAKQSGAHIQDWLTNKVEVILDQASGFGKYTE